MRIRGAYLKGGESRCSPLFSIANHTGWSRPPKIQVGLDSLTEKLCAVQDSLMPKSDARASFSGKQLRWLIIIAALFSASCSGSLYKVKPLAALPPMPANAGTANVGSLSFRAAPLLTDEEGQALFEANLHLAGLLPVRVEIVQNGGDPIELKKLRFQLHDSSSGAWKIISAKQAIARILKANGVYAYNPESRKTFEKEFRSYELDTKSPLSHSEGRRAGFLFFQSAKKEPVASPHGLVLNVEGLAQAINLSLN